MVPFFGKKMRMPSRHGLLKVLAGLFIISALVFQTLSLTGCISTSPTIPSLYVVSLTHGDPDNTTVQVRMGFFGICGIHGSETNCVPTRPAQPSVPDLAAKIFPENKNATSKEVENLITVALNLQNGIFASPLAGGAVAFVLSLAFVLLHMRNLRKAEYYSTSVKIVKRATYALLVLAAAGTGGSALAITQAADALQYASQGTSVVFTAGETLQVCQWIAFGCQAAFLVLVPVISKPREVVYVKEVV
ncbi:hypothetical protein QBC42DRAFT_196338 [Cladorrhinum samala]|uniref:Uncharacterized protein n=1 Tax=Cladorrhinum samala TaxID=585594 RepID=A0AAV9HVQ2_9PEZI|nr:hypothetical protein QBC42DRAFT_196338 [Cladorrhinum samala]